MVKQEETHGCGVQFVMKNIPFFSDMFQYNQGNPIIPYHYVSTYMVYAHLTEELCREDLFLLQSAAAFHDTGKPFCVYLKAQRVPFVLWSRICQYSHRLPLLMELGFE